MKYIIIILVIIFFSCESKDKTSDQYEVTYRMIIKENEKYNSYLLENIQTKIEANLNDKKIIAYDSLTKEYLTFLSVIEKEISKNTSEIFFDNDKYSVKGKEYINKTKVYKFEIEKLTSAENFKKRVNLVLNTNNLHVSNNLDGIAENNEKGESIVGTTYVYYLDYYFRDFSVTQSLAFINNKKRSILELENEFIDSEK